jgi:NhaP-type Na+/H+ or K+/H+ antiporter
LHNSVVGVALVLILGVSAQWLAWKVRLPSIVLLLLTGIVAGPVTGWLDPDALFGNLLQPVVSLSVAVILFEGGLGLELQELRAIGSSLRNLVTVGVLVTWASTAGLAYFVLGLDVQFAVLLGAILVVTGPTVILPLLRHVRPTGEVGSLLKWEGMLNDPVGAILAVLVFEAILLGGATASTRSAVAGFFETLGVGAGVGLAGAAITILALKRYWIPDFLQNAVSLMLVMAVFLASNQLKSEAGLLAVTVMGIALANQHWYPVRHIIEFKENLRVLIISVLFILLAARVRVQDLEQLGWRHAVFLLALILFVRPLAVWLSTIGTGLTRNQRIFVAWMAPRGIVAAAVSALFASELVRNDYPEAQVLVPVTFLVIIGTSAVYGSTAFALARKLGLAEPSPQGVLIVGSHSWAREIAKVLQREKLQVALADSNWENVTSARMSELPAYYGGILSESVLDQVELYGIGNLLAMTSNEEANSLGALHFAGTFGRNRVFQLPPPTGIDRGKRTWVSPQHLSGRLLFSQDATYGALSEKFASGWTVKKTKLTEKFTYTHLLERYGGEVMPLFLINTVGELRIVTADAKPKPKAGDRLISFVGHEVETEDEAEPEEPQEKTAQPKPA